jgi:hypothetical protein
LFRAGVNPFFRQELLVERLETLLIALKRVQCDDGR